MKRVMLYINQLQYHELVKIHLALDSRGGTILTVLVQDRVVVRGVDDLVAAMFTQWVPMSGSSVLSRLIWWPGLSRWIWYVASKMA